jgi:lipoprotein-releasing system permease protein
MPLTVQPDSGVEIETVVPFGRVGPAGDILPEKTRFAVAGTFKTGYFDHDSKTVIMTVRDAKRLLGDNAIIAAHIWLFDPHDAKAAAAGIAREHPDIKVSTWEGANKKLFAALKLERIAMSALLTLIVAIACISIVSIIFMFVFARRKDIAVLGAIGVPKMALRRIFIKIGAFIGICGTAIGLGLGLAACLYLKGHPIILPSSYYLDRLPVVISIPLAGCVAIGGVVLAMLAAYYPAGSASGTKAGAELRYE